MSDTDRLDRIIARVREQYSYIDIDSFYKDQPVPHEWRDLAEVWVAAIEAES